ncbi:hypothetical protein NL478_27155, partial [Klebsiella pneumoniae]|nr:hypothetical protein [Klebsiella pneumoniae]
HVHAVSTEAGSGFWISLELKLQTTVSHHVGGCWELNPGPLQEQLVLLTTEPPLKPYTHDF